MGVLIWKEGRRQMTAHNAAKSYNMLHVFNPEGEIDFSKGVIKPWEIARCIKPNRRKR